MSSNPDLGFQKIYPSFARTCYSDAYTGPAISQLLIDLKMVPYVGLLYSTSSYAINLAKAFTAR